MMPSTVGQFKLIDLIYLVPIGERLQGKQAQKADQPWQESASAVAGPSSLRGQCSICISHCRNDLSDPIDPPYDEFAPAGVKEPLQSWYCRYYFQYE